ncbi:MAG: PHP domain-containing protein [Candidatus Ornithomonoglobus sp.]
MIMDLHNHTTFSYDGKNTPEEIIENAIEHGVDAVGITDHQFSIGIHIREYVHKLLECKAKYAGYIKVLAGLEIGTRPRPDDLFTYDIAGLDFVLFESLDDYRAMDFFEFVQWRHRFECPVGLAHCDIFAMSERYGLDMTEVLKTENIFWELNTSGNYNCYYDFLTNASKREAIRRAGIGVSVGSDTHALCEYRFKQLKRANELVSACGLRPPFVF